MTPHPRVLTVTALVLLATLVRFVDHGLLNVAPVGAIALFGGACLQSRRQAFGVTFATMLFSDALLYTTRYRDWVADSLGSMLFVYLAFGCVVLLGSLLRKQRRSVAAVVAGSLAGSIVFFLISNLSAWLFYAEYSKDVSGLIRCYLAGIPFYRNTLLGDLGFNAVLFGGYAFLEQHIAAPKASE